MVISDTVIIIPLFLRFDDARSSFINNIKWYYKKNDEI